MRPPRIHALLIGIDGYPGPAPSPLAGCVHDIDDLQAVLLDLLAVSPAQITRLSAPLSDDGRVPSSPATRDNILAALRHLAGDAVAPEDRVFIYYSGHGDSVEVRGPRGVTLREALVPVDVSVGADNIVHNLIPDLELLRLLRRISARTEQVTVILDACHAGGLTRGPKAGAPGDTTRFAGLRGTLADPELADTADTGLVRGLASLDACVVAAACLAHEKSTEGLHDDGRRGGYFTRALVRRLRDVPPAELPELRWGQIWRQLSADVAGRLDQHPQLLGSFARKVFGGPRETGDPGFAVRRDNHRYRLSVGSLGGLTPGAEVGVYAGTPVLLPPADSPDARLGVLRVTDAKPGWAWAELAGDTTHDHLQSGVRGRLLKPGRPLLAVAFDPPDLASPDLQATLSASPFLQLAPGGVIIKQRSDGDWALTDELHGPGESPDDPCLVQIPAGTPATTTLKLLTHYINYLAPITFARRCNDPPANLLRISVLDCTDKLVDDQGLIDEPGFDPQNPDLPRLGPDASGLCEVQAGHTAYCIEVQNTGPRALQVTVLESGASGRVHVRTPATIPGRGRHVFWCDDTPGYAFVAGLPEGRQVCFDRTVAIGTTATDVDLRYLATDTAFSDILADAGTRDSVPRTGSLPLWTADELVVRVRS